MLLTGWNKDPIINCIDHELVHVGDYASGRTYLYYKAFSAEQVDHIRI